MDALMQERIFHPLGMRHTAFHLPPRQAGLLAPMVEEEDFGTGVFNDVADMESDKVNERKTSVVGVGWWMVDDKWCMHDAPRRSLVYSFIRSCIHACSSFTRVSINQPIIQ